MSSLRVILPVFIVLGLLQAAVLTLPFAYWRFAAYMGPINKILFGSFLCVKCLSDEPNPSNCATKHLLALPFTRDTHPSDLLTDHPQALPRIRSASSPHHNFDNFHNCACASLHPAQPYVQSIQRLYHACSTVGEEGNPVLHPSPERHQGTQVKPRLASHPPQQLRWLENTRHAAELDDTVSFCQPVEGKRG